MITIVITAIISVIVTLVTYILVTTYITKNSIQKQRATALKEAEAEGEMIKKEKILQAKEKASHIYRLLLKADVNNVKMLSVADADVAEFVVKKGSKVTTCPVMKLGLPHGVNIGGVIRNGKGILVQGRTVLEEGDRVVVFCIGSTLKRLDRFFK